MDDQVEQPEPWDYGRLVVIGTIALTLAFLASQAKEPLLATPSSPVRPGPVAVPDPSPCPDGRCPLRRPHVQAGDFYLQF